MKQYAPHPLLKHLVSCYRIIHFGDFPVFQKPWVVSPTGYNTFTILLAPASVVDVGRNENMNARIRYSGQLDAVRYFVSDVRLNAAIFVDLKPGAGYELLGIPQHDFTNRWQELDTFLPNYSEFYNRLDDYYPNIDQMLSVLDNWLLEMALSSKSRVRSELNFALQLINETNGLIDIVQLRDKVGMARASFQNYFKEQVGVSPKMYSRIVRANAMYKQLNQTATKDWQQIISDFEYFDQAHFIKDFKHFFGSAPSQLFQQNQSNNDFRHYLE